MSAVTPSGVGRSMASPAATIARTHSAQPERVANKSGVKPPVGRYCARGSDVICAPQSLAAARARTSAPCAIKRFVSSALAPSAAHMSAVCSRQTSRALTSAPWANSSFATGAEPARAASISVVSPSAFAASTSAPASSSVATSGALPALTASLKGLALKSFWTSAFAPCASSTWTSSASSLYVAQCSGVVPSPWLPFTSAPSPISSSAAARRPFSIKSARRLSARAENGASEKSATRADAATATAGGLSHAFVVPGFMVCCPRRRRRLDDVVRQRVVMRPESLMQVVEELRGILERAAEPVEHAGLLHVRGRLAEPHVLDHPVEELRHRVELRLHLHAPDDGPDARHETCLLVAEREQARERIETPAEPAAAEPVELGIAPRRERAADRDDVHVRKEDVDVAVRVRLEQVAVVDSPIADRGRAVGVEGLRRPAGRGERRLVAVFVAQVVAGAETLTRLRVRVDRRAGRAERLVRTDLIEMPVRVEKRGDGAALQRIERSSHLVAERGGAAVDEHLARIRREHEDVAARTREQREPGRDGRRREGVGRAHAARNGAETQSRDAGRDAAQHRAAVDTGPPRLAEAAARRPRSHRCCPRCS